MIPVTKQQPDDMNTNDPYYITQYNYDDNTCYFFSYYGKDFAYMGSDYAVAVFKVTPKTK